jgi:replicative DNA helicase
MTVDTRPLPHSIEAERAILGAAIVNPDAICKVLPTLRDAHFFLRQNQIIYRTMEILSAAGKPLDLVVLVDALETCGQLESAGGAAYVSSLLDGVHGRVNIDYHADIVRSKARSRELLHLADRLQSRALESSEPEKIAEETIGELLNIASDQPNATRPRDWKDVSKSAVDQLVSAKLNPEKAARMLFGVPDLDEMVSGLRRKELCLIVAPTSNGKTLLASQLATNAARSGFKGLYFSAEMPAEQVAMREIAYRAKVKFYFTQRPENLRTEELERLSEATTENLSLRIADQDITPARIWATAEAAKRTSGLDFIVVDYDQLVIEAGIDPKSDDDSVFRHQRSFVLNAKRLAERLDVCFVLLCQLRKVSPKIAAGSTPRLDDIWGDSSVRNTPHVILWLVREFFQHDMDLAYERKACAYILKARNGRTGVVPLDFDPEWVRFQNVPKVQPEQPDWVTR